MLRKAKYIAIFRPNNGGPEDMALPIMVKWISHLRDQTRDSANRVVELGAATEAAEARTRWIEGDYPRTCHIIENLYKDLTPTRA